MKNAKEGFDFFLGALAPGGFHGYFDRLDTPPEMRLYLIKSGPGCGKSTLMKQVAAANLERGRITERIHCSSDPDSLDGVVLWQKGAALLDATAPHTLDPGAPGAAQEVVSLYHTMDVEALKANQCEILDLFRTCAYYQERASRTLSSAASLLLDSRRTAASAVDFTKVRLYAGRLGKRLIPSKGEGKGKENIRLLSAVTPQGILTYRDTVPALADQILVLQDEYGAVSRVILEHLRKQAIESGWDVIACWCPTAPEDKLEHLFIPELSLAILTSNSWHPMEFPGQKNILTRRFMDLSVLASSRARLRFNKKAAAQLLEQTSELQRQALETHNKLEEYYRSAIDFSLVDLARDSLIHRLTN